MAPPKKKALKRWKLKESNKNRTKSTPQDQPKQRSSPDRTQRTSPDQPQRTPSTMSDSQSLGPTPPPAPSSQKKNIPKQLPSLQVDVEDEEQYEIESATDEEPEYEPLQSSSPDSEEFSVEELQVGDSQDSDASDTILDLPAPQASQERPASKERDKRPAPQPRGGKSRGSGRGRGGRGLGRGGISAGGASFEDEPGEVEINIDVEKLIDLVQARPALWDSSNQHYCHRGTCHALWVEIFKILCPTWEDLSTGNKTIIGKQILTRWSSVRDRQIRDMRNEACVPSGAGRKQKAPYTYARQLEFLRKVSAVRKTTSSLSCGLQRMEGEQTTPTASQPAPPQPAPPTQPLLQGVTLPYQLPQCPEQIATVLRITLASCSGH